MISSITAPTTIVMILNTAVLVLNASWEPIHVCSARRAMVMIMKGVAIVQETSGQFLRTSRMKIPLPAVVRLLTYRNVPRQGRSVSRKNILIRDGHKCQYCQKFLAGGSLTLDHVIPKSRGGRSSWENLVACCYPCNNKKADRTPDEAMMTLLKKPARFGLHAKHKMLSVDHDTWGRYLFT